MIVTLLQRYLRKTTIFRMYLLTTRVKANQSLPRANESAIVLVRSPLVTSPHYLDTPYQGCNSQPLMALIPRYGRITIRVTWIYTVYLRVCGSPQLLCISKIMQPNGTRLTRKTTFLVTGSSSVQQWNMNLVLMI